MDSALETPKNVQQNNAQNAVLFEAINLTIHLDTEHDLMYKISERLGRFIKSKETNVRYLGLEAMTHLAARAETLDPIKQHQDDILLALKDKDISVRRQGLDLLYSMCDSTNARPIVGELLKYLQTADYAIREEMVLKIAILTEKYATDIQWYVDISLRLISLQLLSLQLLESSTLYTLNACLVRVYQGRAVSKLPSVCVSDLQV